VSIADAILALSPGMYWKLDEGGGTVATNYGSRSLDGTISGSVDLTVPGPEVDTTALRLFLGGQVVSPPMDVVTPGTTSVMLWASTDSTGTNGTVYPIWNVGDPANRTARGYYMLEQHSAMGSPIFRFNVGAGVASGTPNAARTYDWHHYAMTYQTGANGIKFYVDGLTPSQATGSSIVNCQTTDPFLLRCDEPMVVAHVAYFNRVLTQAEIKTVSDQLSPWPLTQPINTGPPSGGDGGGGGGGLTDDQAAQLTAIDTKTDDIPGLVAAATFISDTVNHIKGVTDYLKDQWDAYTSVTLPSLADYLSNILTAVTSSIVDAGTTIAQKAVGELQDWADRGAWEYNSEDLVLTECGELEQPAHIPGIANFGLQLQATVVPPRFGRLEGVLIQYEERLGQFVVEQLDPLDGAAPLYTEVLDLYLEKFTWTFHTWQSIKVAYCVAPGVIIQARWATILPG
jgi:hypothetical protein